MQWDEYLKYIETRKRKSYEFGMRFFKKKFKLENKFELIMKNNEFLIKDDESFRPRNLFNPHESIKAVLGLVN